MLKKNHKYYLLLIKYEVFELPGDEDISSFAFFAAATANSLGVNLRFSPATGSGTGVADLELSALKMFTEN